MAQDFFCSRFFALGSECCEAWEEGCAWSGNPESMNEGREVNKNRTTIRRILNKNVGEENYVLKQKMVRQHN